MNLVRLERWKERLPTRLHGFLDNFFSTCTAFDPADNLANYIRDIDLYARTAKTYRDNRRRLIRAFYDITGTQERGLG